MIVLFFVLYSCITSMFNSVFETNENPFIVYFDLGVELIFVIDIGLNFLHAYRDPDTFKEVRVLKQIGYNYVRYGWFFVDFISVFPFRYLLPQGNAGEITKLLRLARLPRLIKLIDIQRFKKTVQSLMAGGTSREENITMQYVLLYVYKIIRLIIIAMIITYFIGCVWWQVCITSSSFNPGYNFIEYNELSSETTPVIKQLIISCYYALTTLSTVGYGDFFPISNFERITAVIIMLGGVAFFSYIMGNFIEIISNYDSKMGMVDKSAELHNWLILLQRYTKDNPLPKPFTTQIEQCFSYYWTNDRMACFNTEENYLEPLPRKIKNQIVIVYLFEDIFQEKAFKRFFNVETKDEKRFIYELVFGFMPRKFEAGNEEDKVIYDEEEEVSEMYLIMEGTIEIAFSLISNGMRDKFTFGKKIAGKQIIADHYVVNKQKSQWIYMATKDVTSFAITSKFLHENIFPKYGEIYQKLKQECQTNYNRTIYRQLNEIRRQEIEKMNIKSVYREI